MRILWSTALTFSFLPIVMQASVIVCKSGGKILLTCFFFHLTTSFCQAKKMNVLFIGSDDLRPNLGIYSGTCLSSQILVQIPYPFVLMLILYWLLNSISYCPHILLFSCSNFHVIVQSQGRMREFLLVLIWLPQTWIRWANDPSEKFQTCFFEKRRLYLPSWVNVALFSSRPMCSKRWGGDIDSIDQFILMIAKNSFTW